VTPEDIIDAVHTRIVPLAGTPSSRGPVRTAPLKSRRAASDVCDTLQVDN